MFQESGEATMRTIISGLESGAPAYTGADDSFIDAPIDWRRFTDVAEHLGGVASAGDAMRLSADLEQSAELDARAAALVDYRALEDRAAPWFLPPLLRDAMADWAFDEFRAEQASVSDLIVARDEMVASADLVELEIGDQVQREFERATDSMDETWTLLVEQREALDGVAPIALSRECRRLADSAGPCRFNAQLLLWNGPLGSGPPTISVTPRSASRSGRASRDRDAPRDR